MARTPAKPKPEEKPDTAPAAPAAPAYNGPPATTAPTEIASTIADPAAAVITAQATAISSLETRVTGPQQAVLADPQAVTMPLLLQNVGVSLDLPPHLLARNGAWQAVLNERVRQVEVERYAVEGDDTYAAGELVRAAICYSMFAATLPMQRAMFSWPFSLESWKPDDPDRALVKAGALILAELERRYRANPDLIPSQ